jgi:transposase
MGAPHVHDAKTGFLCARGALHPHPEQVQDPLFQHSAFFDGRDVVQVRYEMLRRYRVDGRPAAAVARAFGVSRQALYGFAHAFQAGGLLGLFPRRRGPKGAHKCGADVLAFVRNRRSQFPQRTSDQLRGDVYEQFGVRLHRRTLERRLACQGKKRGVGLPPPNASPLLRSIS